MCRLKIKYILVTLLVVLIFIGTILSLTLTTLIEETQEENTTVPINEDGTILSANNNCEYKNLEFKSVFADAIIDLSAPWSMDMLANPSEEYNSDLAIISCILASTANHQEIFLKNSNQLGFSDVEFENYDKPSIFKPAVSMSYTNQMINGQTANVFLVDIRGTIDCDDVLTDIDDGATDKFFHSAENIETEVLSYMCQEINCSQEDLIDKNNIFLIVGHSLGGATANALSVLLEHDRLSSKSKIFTYTFEAPRTYDTSDIAFSHNGMQVLPKNKDVSNAFNIINNQDIVPLVPTDASGRYGSDVVFDQENLSGGEFSALSLLTDGKKGVESLKTWETGLTTLDYHHWDLDLAYLIEKSPSQIRINNQISINNTNNHITK